MSWPESLEPDHIADLEESGLTPETALTLGLRGIRREETAQHLGYEDKRITSLLCFPYPGVDDFCRDKVFPSNLKDKNAHGRRYLQRAHSGCHLYIPPRAQEVLKNTSVPLRFTEGEKKAAKACQEGYPCIGLGGLWNFGKDGQLLPEFDQIELKNRLVILTPDSEVWAERQRDLLLPVYRFGRLLEGRGAKVEGERLP